jgi:hypothetical protein
MFYFYKHVNVKQAKYWYVTRNVEDILTYSTQHKQQTGGKIARNKNMHIANHVHWR